MENVKEIDEKFRDYCRKHRCDYCPIHSYAVDNSVCCMDAWKEVTTNKPLIEKQYGR